MQKMTKAKTILYLKEKISLLNILPIYVLESDSYFEDKQKTIESIIEFAQDKTLIVRSSSRQEDQEEASNAGKFESVGNVNPNRVELENAIERVYNSYNTTQNEEILIQIMLQDVNKSGVVFTADMETFADYYIVNYYEGNDTSAVTSGQNNNLRVFVAYKGKNDFVEDEDMKALIEVCELIEECLGKTALDIEFAIDKSGMLYIFQVRDIAKANKQKYNVKKLDEPLKRIYKKIEKMSRPHPFLKGGTTYFGVMPDWNPAEILGSRPQKLAISLYRELITDRVWAQQRKNYGYRDLTMQPLMASFCGKPYIDTRVMFNSFIPAQLNENIAEKLVNYYLNQLKQYPIYHDKVEFEIVFSCYYFGVSQKLEKLQEYGFDAHEIKNIEFSLLSLTNRIIHPKFGLYKKDIEKATLLKNKYNDIITSDISLIDKIYWLIEICKEYGTLPFAGVARAGFIASQLLRSFVELDVITSVEYDDYMNSLETISKKLRKDYAMFKSGKLSKEEFVFLYGHLRPGTYDILSERYDNNFDDYFGNEKGEEIQQDIKVVFTTEKLEKVQRYLDKYGFQVNAEELMIFIKEAIEGREYVKYEFTKFVSMILELVAALGERLGIAREEMAHLDIHAIQQLYVELETGNVKEEFEQIIKWNKEQYEYVRQIKLPAIIIDKKDVYNYYLLNEEPNFITQKTVKAEIVLFDNADIDVENKIVFIEAADPGYDFLFSKNIAGLVTKYGGVNSHMAIRCAELGIPAVIGVGQQKFETWSRNKWIEVDCCKCQVINAKDW